LSLFFATSIFVLEIICFISKVGVHNPRFYRSLTCEGGMPGKVSTPNTPQGYAPHAFFSQTKVDIGQDRVEGSPLLVGRESHGFSVGQPFPRFFINGAICSK
jgi:hypothetical protein